MRTLTGQDTAVINAPDGYTVRARVWVWDGSGWQDVTSLEGRDWLVEVAWDESVNEPCAQATVQLRRRQEDLSLNPLVSNKLTGVLALARAFYIEVATLPLGDPPASGDWREVFRGQIERLALDKDPITFTGRDDAGKILRHFIEFEAEYGSTGGTAIQTVMQQILTDNGWPVTLYTPVSPGVVLGKYKQKKMATFLALRERALSIGWDVRMFWDNGTNAFRLTLLGPDRTGALGSQWTFTPGQVKAVTRLEQSLTDIRNAVRLYYYNRSALDSGGRPTRAYVDSSDAASITAYGRLWMQLSEDEDSPVDSPAEAQRMADAARDDLKEPLLDFGVEVGLHYGVQLGDLLTFEADDLHFSSDQTLAVVSAAHRVGRRGHRTTLAVRGKPVAAQDGWLRRESRVVRQPPAYTPDTIAGLAATPTAAGALVTFTAPTVPPFPKEYELHLSTTSGFTPSSATLRERANRTTFELTGLSPTTTYYAKVVPRTGGDEQGVASAQVTVAPRYVAPVDLQPRVTYAALPLNADFEAHTDALAPPDSYVLEVGTWGTDASATTTAYSGSRAVKFEATAVATSLVAQWFTVRTGDALLVSAAIRTPYTGDSADELGVFVRWRAADGTTVQTDTVSLWAATVTDEYGVAGPSYRGTAPAGARFAEVAIKKTAARAFVAYIDSLRAELLPSRERWNTPTLNSPWVNVVGRHTIQYTRDISGRVELRGAASGGTTAHPLFTLPTAYRPAATVRMPVEFDGPAVGFVQIATTGVVSLIGPTTTSVGLDGVCFLLEA